jgi:hypothetical protein
MSLKFEGLGTIQLMGAGGFSGYLNTFLTVTTDDDFTGTDTLTVTIFQDNILGAVLNAATFLAGTTATVGPVPGDVSVPLFADAEQYIITFTAAGQSVHDSIALVASVPELSTWAMMLFGFEGLGLASRRAIRAGASLT